MSTQIELENCHVAQREAMELLATIKKDDSFLFVSNQNPKNGHDAQMVIAANGLFLANVVLALIEQIPDNLKRKVSSRLERSPKTTSALKGVVDKVHEFADFLDNASKAQQAATLLSLAMAAGQGEAFETREAIVKALRAAVFNEPTEVASRLLMEADAIASKYR